MAAPASAPPSAPPAGAPPPPTNPESKQVINVVPPPLEPGAPPAPGSAKARLFEDLRKRGKPATGEPPAPDPAATPPPAKPPEQKPAVPPSGEKPPETPPAGQQTTPPPADPKKPTSPWKLVDQYKARVIELEKQVAEKGAIPEEERKTFQDRVVKAETRVKELEDEIRFVNYRKSKDFQEKYQQPYERAWKAAMSEVGELTVNGPGGSRQVTEQDILELVNLPLAKAREIANEVFGDFADDVMAHRKTIRQLYEAQASALEDAQKNGEQREKDRVENFQRTVQQVQKFVADTWNEVNDSTVKDEALGHYFRPVEGDAEGNKRLEKGFALVDQAWKENPMAPNLTPEQRKDIIRRHSAVRNRAAAFGRLRYQNERLSKRVEELESKLKEFQSSTPLTGGDTKPPTNQGQPSSAKEAVFGALRKLAK